MEPYMNMRATAESMAFHRKFPAAENSVSSAAKATMEIYGVRNRGWMAANSSGNSPCCAMAKVTRGVCSMFAPR